MIPEDVDPTMPLFSPLVVRGTTLPNRIGVSPMCMYRGLDGFANDYHLVHLGRFALGGAGLVTVEATAVSPGGRISHHDLGLWSDDHIPALARIAAFVTLQGAVPGIQLAHAGRRASVTTPWEGGLPVDSDAGGLQPWPVVGPSAVAAGGGWPVPTALDDDGLDRVVAEWASAARRAVDAGFRLVEIHGAHGYLLHEFQSPISNLRDDEYGGSAEARMRFPLRVVRAVREVIPDDIPLSYRISSVDGVEGGLTIVDSIAFARALVEAGVDIIDTSSGGIVTDRAIDTRVRRGFAFHADFSHEIKDATAAVVASVGLIVDPIQAQRLLESGAADIVMLGREQLEDPNWAHHARRMLGDEAFEHWHVEAGYALEGRSRALRHLEDAGETPLSRFS